jgi:hypothetical protein
MVAVEVSRGRKSKLVAFNCRYVLGKVDYREQWPHRWCFYEVVTNEREQKGVILREGELSEVFLFYVIESLSS